MAPIAIDTQKPAPAQFGEIPLKGGIHAPNAFNASQSTPTRYIPQVEASHAAMTCKILKELEETKAITLDGYTLTTAGVVATARFGAVARISDDPEIAKRVADSVEFLRVKLHTSIYGVNTGFGGSADTRTDAPKALQISLIEHQLAGVLPPLGTMGVKGGSFTVSDPLANIMPEAIVRGAILVRVNSLVRGHSAVRMELLENLVALLNKNLTPMVPLRGSISASGDLQPLAYIGATICGHPDVRVMDRSSGSLVILTADQALAKHGIKPVVLGPKEGLGLINGTAFSASAGCLAAHDAHALAMLGQTLTSMNIEAMLGQAGNFHSFIHKIRPHPGQVQAASNMLQMLQGSRLAVHKEEERNVVDEMASNVLRQDRYPLRTSPQWLGPQLEDLLAVHTTLSCEINSTTDNPLLDIEGDHAHHGGNFQATAVAQAMEKTRMCLYMIGKLAFAQTTELINCTMNKGLVSCLAGDEPSTNYHAKGVDITMAAYTAELGYLASPVQTHIQSAEQHNQAVNSMALVSARYTIDAVEVLSMLLSAQLYCVCMAIDLRVMEMRFREAFNDSVPVLLQRHLEGFLPAESVHGLSREVIDSVYGRMEETASMDSSYRFVDVFNHATTVVVDFLARSESTSNPLPAVAAWKKAAAEEAATMWVKARDDYFNEGLSAAEYMGETRALYSYVRETLGVKPRRGDVKDGGHQSSIGADISKIYASLRSGDLYAVLRTLFSA